MRENHMAMFKSDAEAMKSIGQETSEEKNQVEREVSPHNVKELLTGWVNEYESPDTTEADKKELAYKILKMEMALSAAKLEAGSVKIAKEEGGALGLYDPASGDVFITEEGLELPPEHFADVLVHESAHAGKLTGKRLMDEGIAEWRTLMFLPNAMQGIYQAERGRVTSTFGGENMGAVVREKYDYDKPTLLAKWFLETELKDKFRRGLGGKTERPTDTAIKKEVAGIEKLLEKTVPDLYHKLTGNGFDFKKYGVDVVKRAKIAA